MFLNVDTRFDLRSHQQILTLVLLTLVSLSSTSPVTTEESSLQTESIISETTVTPRAHQRVPKTARTTTTTTTTAKPRKIATHAPWPGDEKYFGSTSKPRATHAPWPGDERFYASSVDKSYAAIVNNHNKIVSSPTQKKHATHAPYPFRDQYSAYLDQKEHLYPSRSTYAPYVYGSSSSSQESKKKNLVMSMLDREMINNWAKDVLAYIAAPFMMPSAISNAITNIPNGLEVETFWGKIARSLKSALLKRSSEGRDTSSDDNSEINSDNNLLAALIKKKLIPVTAQLAESVSRRVKDFSTAVSDVVAAANAANKKAANNEEKEHEGDDSLRKKKKSVEYYSGKESNRLVKFIDFFRVKKHRQDPPAVVKKD